MKRKLITLMTLALLVCSGAWAAEWPVAFGTGIKDFTSDGSSDYSETTKATTLYSKDGKFMLITMGSNLSFDSSLGLKIGNSTNGGALMFYVDVDANITVTVRRNGYNPDIKLDYMGSTKPDNLTSSNWTTEGTNCDTKSLTTNGTDYTLTKTAGAAGYYKVYSNSNLRFTIKSIEVAATVPIISTQPVSANYVQNASAVPLSVTATGTGTLYYQWFSNTSESTEGALSVQAKSSSVDANTYTPSTESIGTTYYYCAVTDDKGTTNSSFASINVAAAAAPTISIDASENSVTAGTEITLSADVTGNPSPTLKWYVSDTNNTSTGEEIEGETSTTYTFNAIAGTKYYYAKAFNSQAVDGVASNVETITAAARTGCTLTKAYYNNGFFGEITQPNEANGVIKVFYLSTSSKPTISDVTISDGASYEVEGSTLTVTAEDGTTADYDIEMTAITPYSGVGEYTFTADDSWVRSPYGFGSEEGKEGWKMVQPNTEQRKFSGMTRVTLFLAPSTSVTLTSGSSYDRYLNIYRNTTKLHTDVKLSSNSGTLTVTGDDSNPYILVIEQNRTGGDATIKKINITKAGFESGIISKAGWSTFASSNKLDLSTITGGTAYVASAASGSSVTMKSTNDVVNIGEGLMIKGTPNTAFIISTTSSNPTFSGNNLLVGQTTTGSVAASIDGTYHYVFGYESSSVYGFYNLTDDTELTAGKAYLETEDELGGGNARINIVFDDEETGINDVKSVQKNDNRYYNLNGLEVAQPTKGLYIVNGKKVVIK